MVRPHWHYRIVYEIHDKVLLALVVAVGYRRQIYDRQQPNALNRPLRATT